MIESGGILKVEPGCFLIYYAGSKRFIVLFEKLKKSQRNEFHTVIGELCLTLFSAFFSIFLCSLSHN